MNARVLRPGPDRPIMSAGLHLGFDPEFAPLTYLSGGRPAGRAIEIVRAACACGGVALEFVPVGLGAPVSSGGLDGYACMAITPGRTGFTFSLPYMTTEAAFFVARRAPERGAEDPVGAITVATPRAGPLLALLLERISKTPAGEEGTTSQADAVAVRSVVPGTGYRDCLERVLRGDVDAAALNAEVGRAMVGRLFPGAFVELPAPLPPLGLAVALTGEPRAARLVLDRLDPALERVRREGSA